MFFVRSSRSARGAARALALTAPPRCRARAAPVLNAENRDYKAYLDGLLAKIVQRDDLHWLLARSR